MVDWFIKLSNAEKIAVAAIVASVGTAVIGGVIGLCKWLFRKKDAPAPQQNTIDQDGSDHTAANIDGCNNIVARGDVNTGIDGELAIRQLIGVSKEAGQSEEKIKNLEKQLAQQNITADTGTQQMPQPSQEAKDLAAQIEDDDAPYARALKAIAEGDNEKADSFLDETQQFLDTVQQAKDAAQAKVYVARMQNASYAGRHQEALQYCDQLTPLAGDESPIISNIAAVYYENAKYNEAEPLMKRALAIDEASLGSEHPKVATALNNLAALYQSTNRLNEAEPLMKRALAIDEASLGSEHPAVATDLNNLAGLYQATNRLNEAEPLAKRALAIDEASLGSEHPAVAIDLNNLAALYKATNRLDEAEPLMRRALAIFEISLGAEHPNTKTVRRNLDELK